MRIPSAFPSLSSPASSEEASIVTPAEAGWSGHLTLEFSNSAAADYRIYANEGIVQMLFFQGEPCTTPYLKRAGNYQCQKQSKRPKYIPRTLLL